MTPEGRFKKKVIKALKDNPKVVYWVSEARYRRGLPDIVGVVFPGIFFAFEVKPVTPYRKDGKPKSGRIKLQSQPTHHKHTQHLSLIHI